jgi:hypothetical protein
MEDVRHIVLVRPGDVLLIGNVGTSLDDDGTEALQQLGAIFRDGLGIEVVAFEADINVDMVPGGSG